MCIYIYIYIYTYRKHLSNAACLTQVFFKSGEQVQQNKLAALDE